jgi:hypothetical protein
MRVSEMGGFRRIELQRERAATTATNPAKVGEKALGTCFSFLALMCGSASASNV